MGTRKIEITVHYSGHQKVFVDPKQVVKAYRNNLRWPGLYKNSGSAMDAAVKAEVEEVFN